MTIAALYVQPDGCYFAQPDVDPWDEARDARTYAGPWPVVAHPPCARWGRYWFGGPMWVARGNPRKRLGDDGGCFAAALAAVRRFGGVLEHPAHSHAWEHFALNTPPRAGGWVAADFAGGWTCCVEQGHYGHAARKSTWLYAAGLKPPTLKWGMSDAIAKWAAEGRPERSMARARRDGICVLLSGTGSEPRHRPTSATSCSTWRGALPDERHHRIAPPRLPGALPRAEP